MMSSVNHAESVRFPAALALEHPLTVLYHTSSSKSIMTTGQDRVGIERAQSVVLDNHHASTLVSGTRSGTSGVPTGFPEAVWSELIVRLDAPPNASFAVRVQNTVAGGAAITVPSLAAALGLDGMCVFLHALIAFCFGL